MSEDNDERLTERKEHSSRPPVINKTVGTCPVCGYKIFESNSYIRADHKVIHQHCIQGATLKAALELGDLMRELIDLLNKKT